MEGSEFGLGKVTSVQNCRVLLFKRSLRTGPPDGWSRAYAFLPNPEFWMGLALLGRMMWGLVCPVYTNF